MSYPLCVCVVVMSSDGQVLSTSRRHDPDAWGLPGGKVDPEDGDINTDMEGTLRAAGVRELYEETGLRVAPDTLIPLYTGPCKDESGGGNPDAMSVTYTLTLADAEKALRGAPSGYLRADPTPSPSPLGDGIFWAWKEWRELISEGAFRSYNRKVYLSFGNL